MAISLVEGNMDRQINDEIPDDAPALFLVDIQSTQLGGLLELVQDVTGPQDIPYVPSLRGRIIAANGVPAEEAMVNDEHDWVLRGDRGVTYSAVQRENHEIMFGEWWSEDYAGPPLVSVYRDIADAFGLVVGDTLTVNILGRDIEAEIANIRDINWNNLGINFTLVFSPEPLRHAPFTALATVDTAPGQEDELLQRLAEAYPNVTAVPVGDILETVNQVLGDIANAVRGIAAITLVAGTLVLAGAVAAGHRRRIYDAVVLKVLGATRGTVLRAFLLEYGLLGLVTALIAAGIGTLAGWAILTFVMAVEWNFLVTPVIVTTALCTFITLALDSSAPGGHWGKSRRRCCAMSEAIVSRITSPVANGHWGNCPESLRSSMSLPPLGQFQLNRSA